MVQNILTMTMTDIHGDMTVLKVCRTAVGMSVATEESTTETLPMRDRGRKSETDRLSDRPLQSGSVTVIRGSHLHGHGLLLLRKPSH